MNDSIVWREAVLSQGELNVLLRKLKTKQFKQFHVIVEEGLIYGTMQYRVRVMGPKGIKWKREIKQLWTMQ